MHGQFSGYRGQIASMLGLASETGAILDSHKRYLRDSIDLPANREFLRGELGDLLWYLAAVATACNLNLADIAKDNLLRARKLYRTQAAKSAAQQAGPRSQPRLPTSEISREFSNYQKAASTTSRLTLRGPEGPIAPMLGLASATGAILNVPKKQPDAINLPAKKAFLREKLGDLLWYLAAVATACDLDLGQIAEDNLRRAGDLYADSKKSPAHHFKELLNFDDPAQAIECFPRKMVVRFEEQEQLGGPPVATQTLHSATPNAFPNGPIPRKGGKLQGFRLGEALGDPTTDNSRRADGYRYHDAIHMAFMAVLGWSPTMRALLRVKRKSKTATDRDEDGARAIYTEEGLAAILSRLAKRRMGFLGENTIDGEVIATARAIAQGLEIQVLPGWLWRRAISQGFQAMSHLDKNKGGYLTVDLDKRELTYTKTEPHDL
jgi:NTP pyrophosphatase (non-canonical NTP hydrolase)